MRVRLSVVVGSGVSRRGSSERHVGEQRRLRVLLVDDEPGPAPSPPRARRGVRGTAGRRRLEHGPVPPAATLTDPADPGVYSWTMAPKPPSKDKVDPEVSFSWPGQQRRQDPGVLEAR